MTLIRSKNLWAVLLLALLLAPPALAQRKVTISGHITDTDSGETLIGAGILEGKSRTGAVTNNYGYYTLTLPAGEYDFQYSFVGYGDEVMHVGLQRDTVVNVALKAGEMFSSSHQETLSILMYLSMEVAPPMQKNDKPLRLMISPRRI